MMFDGQSFVKDPFLRPSFNCLNHKTMWHEFNVWRSLFCSLLMQSPYRHGVVEGLRTNLINRKKPKKCGHIFRLFDRHTSVTNTIAQGLNFFLAGWARLQRLLAVVFLFIISSTNHHTQGLFRAGDSVLATIPWHIAFLTSKVPIFCGSTGSSRCNDRFSCFYGWPHHWFLARVGLCLLA